MCRTWLWHAILYDPINKKFYLQICFMPICRAFFSCRSFFSKPIIVTMSAKCSDNLMQAPVTGNRVTWKRGTIPHDGLSNFNYLSGECILTCASKHWWPLLISACIKCASHVSVCDKWRFYSNFKKLWLFSVTWRTQTNMHVCQRISESPQGDGGFGTTKTGFLSITTLFFLKPMLAQCHGVKRGNKKKKKKRSVLVV